MANIFPIQTMKKNFWYSIYIIETKINMLMKRHYYFAYIRNNNTTQLLSNVILTHLCTIHGNTKLNSYIQNIYMNMIITAISCA